MLVEVKSLLWWLGEPFLRESLPASWLRLLVECELHLSDRDLLHFVVSGIDEVPERKL